MSYKRSRKDMPGGLEILTHWKSILSKKHNRGIKHKHICFACLRDGYVERCHIEPFAYGGLNNVNNLHILCPNCHKESEGYRGRFYWIWFKSKDILMLPIYRDREQSSLCFTICQIIKKEAPDIYASIANNKISPKEAMSVYDNFIETTKGDYLKPKTTQKTLF